MTGSLLASSFGGGNGSGSCAVAEAAPEFQGRFVLVDGLNLIRIHGPARPQMNILLNVLAQVSGGASDFLCIFDACTEHVVKHRNDEATAYRKLLEFNHFFHQTTGGVWADDLLLPLAHRRQGVIVSRDRFRNYASKYPWVTTAGRVQVVDSVRETIFVGGDTCEIRADLDDLMREIISNMERIYAEKVAATLA